MTPSSAGRSKSSSTSAGSSDTSTTLVPADQAVGEAHQTVDIVHVDGQQWQFDHDDVFGEVGEAGDLLTLGCGQLGELVVPRDLFGKGTVDRDPSSATRSAALSCSGIGWIKLTTTPANGNDPSRRAPIRCSASPIASARGLDTTTNDATSDRNSTDTSSARLRSPGSMFASERKNSTVSSTICGPARRRTAHRNIDAAAFVTFANARWPTVSAR